MHLDKLTHIYITDILHRRMCWRLCRMHCFSYWPSDISNLLRFLTHYYFTNNTEWITKSALYHTIVFTITPISLLYNIQLLVQPREKFQSRNYLCKKNSHLFLRECHMQKKKKKKSSLSLVLAIFCIVCSHLLARTFNTTMMTVDNVSVFWLCLVDTKFSS